MLNNCTYKKISSTIIKGIFLVGVLLIPNLLLAQESPPTPVNVTVDAVKFLNFGSFTFTNAGTGGTVSVDSNGSRTSSGDIILLNFGATSSSASFDVTANPGTILNITHPNNIPLTESSGGTIYLNIDSYYPGKTFLATAAPPMTTPISIGGTLSIGDISQNPAGNYTGSVNITLIQQ
jgi:Flp pilus assembly protein TadG